jgi:hypothetical protein
MNTKCHGQDKYNISAGIGFMELLNVGVQYNFNENIQTGLSLGSYPTGGSEITISLKSCINYYYTGISTYTKQPTWYLNCGINYWYDGSTSYSDNWVILNLRHGKVFNFSRKSGLRIEAGIGMELIYFEKKKEDDYYSNHSNHHGTFLFPNINIEFFHRFN